MPPGCCARRHTGLLQFCSCRARSSIISMPGARHLVCTSLAQALAKWLRGGGGGAASSASLQLQQPQPQRQRMVLNCPSCPPRMQKPAVTAAEEKQQSAAERMRSAQAEEAQRQAVLVGQAALGLPRMPRLVSLRREAQVG